MRIMPSQRRRLKSGPATRSQSRSALDRDFAAMARVWWMLRQGAVRMLGEIGRQY